MKTVFPSMPAKLHLSKDIPTTETPEQTAAAMHYVSSKVVLDLPKQSSVPHKVHVTWLF